VAERGALADADGGLVVLAMAERIEASAAARIAAVLDAGEVALERDGLARRLPAHIGVVALDEGVDDEAPPTVLTERLALHVTLEGLRDLPDPPRDATAVAAARDRLARVEADGEVARALCAAALSLGIVSLRPPLMALRAARAHAALAGREAVTRRRRRRRRPPRLRPPRSRSPRRPAPH
jgi:magnesium chelatase subunit D